MVSDLQKTYLKNLELGFTIETIPNRKWLLDILFTLNPLHVVFTGIEIEDKMVEIPVR